MKKSISISLLFVLTLGLLSLVSLAQARSNSAPGQPDVPVDFDGDGRTDVAVFTPNNEWWVGLSTGANFGAAGGGHWPSPAGLWGEIPLAGDFNGDGETDAAVFTPNNEWWVGISSSAAFTAAGGGRWASPVGLWGELPLTGDFNGDGRTDVAVFTPNDEWWVGLSSGAAFTATGSGHWASSVGLWGEIPSTGDFNGDGRTDVAVFTPNDEWWVGLSTGTGFNAPGSGHWASPVGLWGEIPLTGDFNGDNKTDIVMFNRNNQWWVGLSSGAAFTVTGSGQWNSPAGLWGEIPLAGDFNGDDKTDVAVFTPNDEWWVGVSTGVDFGAAGGGHWASPAGLWCEVPVNIPAFLRFSSVVEPTRDPWLLMFPTPTCRPRLYLPLIMR
jgi:hypothetical protein